MGVEVSAQVFGIQETLKEINTFDVKYRRQITVDIQSGAGKLVVDSVRTMIPKDYPLSGMRRGSMIKGRDGTAYSIQDATAGVKTFVAKRGSREKTVTFTRYDRELGTKYTQTIDFNARPFALLTASQKNTAAAIWDHSGLNTKSQFVANLDAEGPAAPRAMVPGVAAVLPDVEREVSKILDAVSAKMNVNLKIERR